MEPPCCCQGSPYGSHRRARCHVSCGKHTLSEARHERLLRPEPALRALTSRKEPLTRHSLPLRPQSTCLSARSVLIASAVAWSAADARLGSVPAAASAATRHTALRMWSGSAEEAIWEVLWHTWRHELVLGICRRNRGSGKELLLLLRLRLLPPPRPLRPPRPPLL